MACGDSIKKPGQTLYNNGGGHSVSRILMNTFLIIAGVLLWAASLAALFSRPLLSPAMSYIALLCVSFCERYGYPLLPVNNTILYGWLCITVVVMLATMMQPPVVRRQSRGMGYITGGALTGLAVGLLGFTFSSNVSLLYSVMVTGVAAGVFFGFLLYSRTPAGAPVAPGSGNFFSYLLAKGFPAAVTVMMMGIVAVILVALNRAPL